MKQTLKLFLGVLNEDSFKKMTFETDLHPAVLINATNNALRGLFIFNKLPYYDVLKLLLIFMMKSFNFFSVTRNTGKKCLKTSNFKQKKSLEVEKFSNSSTRS